MDQNSQPTPTQRGRFIVVEGIDGSGKSTQIPLLAERLRAGGRHVCTTAEPTVSLSGGMLRDALRGVTPKTPCEIAAMFLLDRIFHNADPVAGIEKLLSSGADVICDRYYYSSLAYQGSETDFTWVYEMNLRCPGIRKPDLCLFLDISPAEAVRRITKNRSVTEIYEKEERLTEFRRRYLSVFSLLKSTDHIVIIPAEQSATAITDAMEAAVAALPLTDLT